MLLEVESRAVTSVCLDKPQRFRALRLIQVAQGLGSRPAEECAAMAI
jgi:hypothetical protein